MALAGILATAVGGAVIYAPSTLPVVSGPGPLLRLFVAPIAKFTIGITVSNFSILKTGKARAAKFSTLSAICEALDAQPGDLLEYIPDDQAQATRSPIGGLAGR